MADRSRREIVAENIKRARADAGLSQQALANKLGIAREKVNMYENGRREPGEDRLRELAVVLELPHWTYFYVPQLDLNGAPS